MEPEQGLRAGQLLGRCTWETVVQEVGSDSRRENQNRDRAHKVIMELTWAPFRWHLPGRRLIPPASALLPECAKPLCTLGVGYVYSGSPPTLLEHCHSLHSQAPLACARRALREVLRAESRDIPGMCSGQRSLGLGLRCRWNCPLRLRLKSERRYAWPPRGLPYIFIRKCVYGSTNSTCQAHGGILGNEWRT